MRKWTTPAWRLVCNYEVGLTRPGTQSLNFVIGITNVTDLTFDGLFAAAGNEAGVPRTKLVFRV